LKRGKEGKAIGLKNFGKGNKEIIENEKRKNSGLK